MENLPKNGGLASENGFLEKGPPVRSRIHEFSNRHLPVGLRLMNIDICVVVIVIVGGAVVFFEFHELWLLVGGGEAFTDMDDQLAHE
jgi:hypothetical protein